MQPHVETAQADTPTLAALRRPIVWTIAGSDSGGGAGIQADLHSMHAMGVHACTVITAITAQNSVAVTRVEAVSDALLQAQIDALQSDLPPQAIKIGLVASSAQQQFLAERLRQLPQSVPIVIDPVMVASCGDSLLTEHTSQVSALPSLYLQASVLTPNLPELAALTGMSVNSPAQIVAATEHLLSQGVAAVLVKGGHRLQGVAADDWSLDYFATQAGRQVPDNLKTRTVDAGFWLASPRRHSPHHHGTGCRLASVIASALALDYPLHDAVVLAKAYLNHAFVQDYATGEGAGTLWDHCLPTQESAFPTLLDTAQVTALLKGDALSHILSEANRFAALTRTWMGLYPVVDSLAWTEQLLRLGVKTLQLRVKSWADEAHLAAEIEGAVALGRHFDAQVFINDHWQLALRFGAYGVHLGQEDLATADLAALQQAGVRLGISSHGYAELLRAKSLQPSYIALGHIFATQTKNMPSKPQGLERLARYVPVAAPFPTVAIGGINTQRVVAVAATGVDGIALVTAITQAPDPAQHTQELLKLVEQSRVDHTK